MFSVPSALEWILGSLYFRKELEEVLAKFMFSSYYILCLFLVCPDLCLPMAT